MFENITLYVFLWSASCCVPCSRVDVTVVELCLCALDVCARVSVPFAKLNDQLALLSYR
jgi:hypothetical protein